MHARHWVEISSAGAADQATPEISQRWVAYAPRPARWVLLLAQPPGPLTHSFDVIRQSAVAEGAGRGPLWSSATRHRRPPFHLALWPGDLLRGECSSRSAGFMCARTTDVAAGGGLRPDAIPCYMLSPGRLRHCRPDALPQGRPPGRHGRCRGDAAPVRAPGGRPPPPHWGAAAPPLCSLFIRSGHVPPLAVVAATVVPLRRPPASVWPPLSRRRRSLRTWSPMRPSWPAGRAS